MNAPFVVEAAVFRRCTTAYHRTDSSPVSGSESFAAIVRESLYGVGALGKGYTGHEAIDRLNALHAFALSVRALQRIYRADLLT
jgi:hypothetical protein